MNQMASEGRSTGGVGVVPGQNQARIANMTNNTIHIDPKMRHLVNEVETMGPRNVNIFNDHQDQLLLQQLAQVTN